MNSNVNELANALQVYCDFVQEVQKKYGEDGFLDCKYSYQEIDELQMRLKRTDSIALEKGNMWHDEIRMLRGNKEMA